MILRCRYAAPVIVLGALLSAPYRQAQTTTHECLHNARQLSQAVYEYSRDHWLLPPTGSQAAFEKAMAPYVSNSSVFRCPVTGQKYHLNPLIDSVWPWSIPDYGATLVLEDAVPHSDGKSTVAFLDGYVLYGGIDAFPVGDSVTFAGKLGRAILAYTQDYDEVLPPMIDDQEFRRVVEPYTQDSRVFYSTLTDRPFEINRSLSRQTLAQFKDPSTVILLQDLALRPGGLNTIVFLDGTVERGGVVQPNVNVGCLSNVKRLAMGTLMYAQDYDEVLPPMENYGRFQAVTFPYARSSKAFVCPATGLPYTLNVSLSQKNVITITDPAHTLLLRDTAPHQDGATTYGYLDGHVKRK